MADFNIGGTSGLGGFATAMPGAIDEWIRQNEQQRQAEGEGRLQQALAPYKEQMAKSQAETGMLETQMTGQKASLMAQAIGGFQSGQPLSEMHRAALGLKGRDPQIVLNEKLMLERIKQSELFEKSRKLVELHQKGQEELLSKRQGMMKDRPPTQSQVLGGILQAEIEGKATPGMKSAWRLAHPLEGQVLDKVERELMHNEAYKVAVATGDVPTANKLRQDTMERLMTFMGMNPAASHEELGENEEIMPSEEKAQFNMLTKAIQMMYSEQP